MIFGEVFCPFRRGSYGKRHKIRLIPIVFNNSAVMSLRGDEVAVAISFFKR